MILKLKHWQVFIYLLVGMIVYGTTVAGNPLLSSFLRIAGALTYLSWPLLVGHALYQRTPEKIELPYNLFIINSFLVIAGFSVAMIISGGEPIVFYGWLALAVFYAGFAMIHSFAFPVKALRSIELGEEATVGQYIGDFFLVAFLPMGIWFLQPRINAVAEASEDSI